MGNIPKIYSNEASLFDLLYGNKDYEKESEIINQIIDEYKKSSGEALLDVACGTGGHLQYLSKNFKCDGLDINEDLLRIAANKAPKTHFIKDDMSNFKLQKRYDVITCLFSSIGYTETLDRLRKTIDNFYHHLTNGGVVIIEPWFSKNDKYFVVNKPFMTNYENEDIEISRISIAHIKNNLSIMDTHYLIGETGKGIQHFSEKHTLGLFEKNEIIKAMIKSGFKTTFQEKGLNNEERGLFIGVKN